MTLTQLTKEQLARLRAWWGDKDPYATRYVSEELWTEYAEAEWSAQELIEILQDHLNGLPKPERANARIILNEGYEGGGSLKLSYTREMTDAEKQVEIDRAVAWLNENDERDQREFARLKAKFGAP